MLTRDRCSTVIALAAITLCCRPGLTLAQHMNTPIDIQVDMTRAAERILHAQLTMPVEAGPLTLLYPKYLPGEHGPTGPIPELVGLKITAAGNSIPWDRDPRDAYTFYVEVPAGVSQLDIELDYLPPRASGQFGNGPATSDRVAVMSWNTLLLYPAGQSIHELRYRPSLKLPDGWKAGTALRQSGQEGNVIRYETVSLAELVDSPVNTGAHFRELDLTGNAAVPHRLHLAADSAAAMEIRPETEAAFRKLVAEGNTLFGSYHYRTYDFLLTLSDHIDSFGLEHHESSDNRLPERSLIDDERLKSTSTLLPHEFVHTWNAKYRRPAGLARDDFQEPFDPDLLWIYEGLTQYLGLVLTARSGLWTPEYAQEAFAQIAAELSNRPGRTWRPLVDTARAAYLLYGVPTEWNAWRRGVDFYDESALIWLEADVLIRTLTRNSKSLDDFCRAFFGGENGKPEVKPYTYEEFTTALAQVADYDWRKFLDDRIYSVRPQAPLDGFTNAGWQLVYSSKQNTRSKDREKANETLDLWYSLGITLSTEASSLGRLLDVLPDSPASKAGLVPGSTLVAVNGRRWTVEVLLRSITEAKSSGAPIRLLVESVDFYHEVEVDYRDGDRYPHLERIQKSRDLLSAILAPRTR